MGDKIKKTIKEIELRSLAVAVFCIAILVVVAINVNNITPGTSAWNPNPTDVTSISPQPWDNITPVFGKETIITDFPLSPFWGTCYLRPNIHDGKVVFDGNLHGADGDIYIYNIFEQDLLTITKDDISQMVSDVYNNIVVYNQNSGSYYNDDVFAYDLNTGDRRQITFSDFDESQTIGSIYGDKIVWRKINSSGEGIYMYNLNDPIGVITQITHSPGSKSPPQIDENIIVWAMSQDIYNDDNYDIYMYDINNPEQGVIQITNNSDNQTLPRIHNHKVVWQDDRNGNWDIYIYDINNPTQGIIQITTDDTNQVGPDIYNSKVIWTDWRNDNGQGGPYPNLDIYMYDLTKEIEIPICTNNYYQRNPKISDNIIVWEDWRDYPRMDIYMFELFI